MNLSEVKRSDIHTINAIQVVFSGRTQGGRAVYWLERWCCEWKVVGLIPALVGPSVKTLVSRFSVTRSLIFTSPVKAGFQRRREV